MNNVIGVIHPVTDLKQARDFLDHVLEFSVREQGEEFATMENGALSIRLLHDTEGAARPLHLDVYSNDLDESMVFYAGHGLSRSGELKWATQFRQQIELHGPNNIHLTLFREYDEDELGILPDLPTSLDWHPDALELTKHLLRIVPLAFRQSARKRITENAEADAIVAGLVEVDQTLALQTMIKVTPAFQHDSLKQAIANNELDPKDYFSDV